MTELLTVIMTVLISFYSLQLPQPVDTVDYSNTSDMILNKAVMRAVGENGFSDEGVFLTTCTVLNRLSRGYGDGNIDKVLSFAYYAPDVQYTDAQYQYVKDNLDSCPKNILYALSYSDTRYLGFPIENADFIVGNDICKTYDKRNTSDKCAYFFSSWKQN